MLKFQRYQGILVLLFFVFCRAALASDCSRILDGKSSPTKTVDGRLVSLDWRDYENGFFSAQGYFGEVGEPDKVSAEFILQVSKDRTQKLVIHLSDYFPAFTSGLKNNGIDLPMEYDRSLRSYVVTFSDFNSQRAALEKTIIDLGGVKKYPTSSEIAKMSSSDFRQFLLKIINPVHARLNAPNFAVNHPAYDKIFDHKDYQPRAFRWMRIFTLDDLQAIVRNGLKKEDTIFGGSYFANDPAQFTKFGSDFGNDRPYWSVLLVVKTQDLYKNGNTSVPAPGVFLFANVPSKALEHVYVVNTSTSPFSEDIPFIDVKDKLK